MKVVNVDDIYALLEQEDAAYLCDVLPSADEMLLEVILDLYPECEEEDGREAERWLWSVAQAEEYMAALCEAVNTDETVNEDFWDKLDDRL